MGRLESRDLSPRSRVWAEPETVGAAACEFAGIEAMIVTAEGLFGPYDWDRYDMLVLPPSFPYGGMENPRMTFLTPTLLAGDRSLVDVVAHELAHSWTGNLVTNATMDHFWLNEGFTVWAERRILEALHGAEAASWAGRSARRALDLVARAVRGRLTLHPPAHRPRRHGPRRRLLGDPLREGLALPGPARAHGGTASASTRFMREYMDRFRFTSITTEEFLSFLEQKLPGASTAVDARRWLYEPGIPENAPVFRSPALESLDSTRRRVGPRAGAPLPTRPPAGSRASCSSISSTCRESSTAGSCRWLDEHLQLTGRGNYEILVGMADDRGRLGLRAGVPAAARGAAPESAA